MGSFLDKPKTEKTNESGHGNHLGYGLGAMQGWRIEMEDSHCSLIGLPLSGFEDWSFFAVFDGHAGGTVSKYSAQELIKSILNADADFFKQLAIVYSTPSQTDSTTTAVCSTNGDSNNGSDKTNNLGEETASTTSNLTSNGIDCSVSSLDSAANTTSSVFKTALPVKPSVCFNEEHENRLKAAIRKGFLDLDDKIRHLPEFERGEDKSGSTAVACLISPTHCYLINCGDSRALVCSDNQVVLSTYDHKPINPAERERIHNAGGSVMIQRVNGSLAVSRALGDFEYKCVENRGPCEQLVSPEPEVYTRERSYEKDEFVVLACDGIWDVMTNEDLKEFVHSRLKVTNDLVRISNEVLDLCLNKGSRDNMSIIIVTFPGAPKINQEEVDKDNSCNEKIEGRIKGK